MGILSSICNICEALHYGAKSLSLKAQIAKEQCKISSAIAIAELKSECTCEEFEEAAALLSYVEEENQSYLVRRRKR